MATATLNVVVEFMGGLEMLFSNQKEHKLVISKTDSKGDPVTAGWLVQYLCDEIMTDSRKNFFVMDGHVRPGILVLINDADWELDGEASYELQPNDTVLFVSTLHGG